MSFCPVHPKPLKTKASFLWMYLFKRRSWMDGLFERSYRMKMGEVHLPGLDLYMVNEPRLWKQVLVDEAPDFPKHELLGHALEPLLGESIFTTNGAQWQRQRDMMEKSFEAARIKHVFGLMRDAADAMRDRLDALPDAVEHDVELEMTHVTADIIFRTILSTPLEGEDAQRIFRAFSRFQELAPKLIMPVIFRWPRLFHPWLAARASKAAAKEIRGVLEGFIRPRHDAWAAARASAQATAPAAASAGKPACPFNADGPDDILSSLLDAVDPATGTHFSFKELVDQVAMLFLAGHETSASALSWSLYLIANAPDIQQRMHDEVMAECGDRPIGFAELRGLELVRNVFRETLRLYPPVGFFARATPAPRRMRDKHLPADSTIVIAPWLIHRHRDYWERPDDFDPDRYAGEAARESLKNAYLPFSAGPRVCIGAAFALQEAALILATLVRRYRFEPLASHVPEPVGRLTIRSENGIRLAVHKRAG
ncbi:cytochrome P450 [Derxia gummosa]|uniref:Cytochrome P450 n=1 Tax=Derxia gummosa DSM 723 TaxID=1121388 RepID=A0A8B6X0Q0_9BURK|nr:cytochrome P450 [Derxia gummosa]